MRHPFLGCFGWSSGNTDPLRLSARDEVPELSLNLLCRSSPRIDCAAGSNQDLNGILDGDCKRIQNAPFSGLEEGRKQSVLRLQDAGDFSGGYGNYRLFTLLRRSIRLIQNAKKERQCARSMKRRNIPWIDRRNVRRIERWSSGIVKWTHGGTQDMRPLGM